MMSIADQIATIQHQESLNLYTIGYSVRPFKTIINMLIAREIEQVIDVRLNDYSRNFDFNGQNRDLTLAFASYGINYEHRKELGIPDKFRKLFKKDRQRWKRIYFGRFRASDRIAFQHLFTRQNTCIMCAEKDFRKCHRLELAEWLVKGANPRIKVIHL